MGICSNKKREKLEENEREKKPEAIQVRLTYINKHELNMLFLVGFLIQQNTMAIKKY